LVRRIWQDMGAANAPHEAEGCGDLFDELYGFLPPHPANPPTKRPLVALMKQARAVGVGVRVVTQNPMDLDYRALSNAGLCSAS